MRAPARLLLIALAASAAAPAMAAAQPKGTGSGSRPPATSNPSTHSPRRLEIAGFADAGRLSLAATRSFEAVLGSASGAVVGGGGEVTVRRGRLRGLFARVDVSRFEEFGERVFVFEGQVFRLGVPATVTLTPVEVTGGYRVELPKAHALARVTPFAGLGVGSIGYRETSSTSEPGEDVDERFTSYHVLGGADVRVWRGLSAGVEGLYRWAPDALGASGVSQAFNETSLDGATVRVRVRVGF